MGLRWAIVSSALSTSCLLALSTASLSLVVSAVFPLAASFSCLSCSSSRSLKRLR